MRKAYVNKVIFMTLMSMAISVPVHAAWNKDNDKWSWIDNQEKAIGWKIIEDKWYHFDDNGYMNTGWLHDDDKWYRLRDDGTMCVEWQEIDGKWYYFNESGIMQSGWVNDNGSWYIFDENGIMKTGWVNDNDKWYHMSSNGVMDTGWTEIDGEWYMFNDNGVMCTGWISDNGTWYYANLNGKLEKGSISIDGKTYIFAENGAMLGGSSSENIPSDYIQSETESQAGYTKRGYVNTNSDSLNVRSDASITSSVIDKLPKGSEISIIGDSQNGFYPIMLNDKKAWVSSDWISFEKPVQYEQEAPSIIEESEDTNQENSKPKEDIDIKLGAIRTTEPSLNDIHYYSDSNIFYKVRLSPPFFNSSGNQIRGNCTWYAWGRAWELTGEQPIQANFIGNAYEWWNPNIKSGKYRYGSEPRVGSIAVWNSSLPGSGGCGHVAVVEKIDNGKIYISESMWHGDCFKYQEIYSTEYLYGYIYLDEPNY